MCEEKPKDGGSKSDHRAPTGIKSDLLVKRRRGEESELELFEIPKYVTHEL